MKDINAINDIKAELATVLTSAIKWSSGLKGARDTSSKLVSLLDALNEGCEHQLAAMANIVSGAKIALYGRKNTSKMRDFQGYFEAVRKKIQSVYGRITFRDAKVGDVILCGYGPCVVTGELQETNGRSSTHELPVKRLMGSKCEEERDAMVACNPLAEPYLMAPQKKDEAPQDNRTVRTTLLAFSCAKDAWDASTPTTRDLVPEEPQAGDLDALQDELGGEPTEDDLDMFRFAWESWVSLLRKSERQNALVQELEQRALTARSSGYDDEADELWEEVAAERKEAERLEAALNWDG